MNTPVSVRLLSPGDVAILENVAPGVFDKPIEPSLAAEFLGDLRHHMVVAIAADQIVGMASAVHYVHPDTPPELWINEVGVASGHRRQGIGKQLMKALFARGRALGCAEAWLGTEKSNTPARRLYSAVGGAEEPMIYVTFPLAAKADGST
jgi:ribosomal protein S18 acetylase RimI-like enzyme